jgi:hypothetical protein
MKLRSKKEAAMKAAAAAFNTKTGSTSITLTPYGTASFTSKSNSSMSSVTPVSSVEFEDDIVEPAFEFDQPSRGNARKCKERF